MATDNQPGRVWFTLEALVDDGSKGSRYSVTKSAATIGLLAVAVGAVAATAGAALLPTAAVGGVSLILFQVARADENRPPLLVLLLEQRQRLLWLAKRR